MEKKTNMNMNRNMDKLPKISSIWPSIRALNIWTLKQKIKDRTLLGAHTFKLFQRIDIIKWNDPESIIVNTAMLSIYSRKVKCNPNVRFKSDLHQAKDRFIKMHGKVEKTTGDMVSHSFVLAFMQCLEVVFAHSAEVGVGPLVCDPVFMRDDTNTVRTVNNSSFHDYSGNSDGKGSWALEGGVTVADYGIVAGVGTSSPTGYDYDMESLIAHGTGSGQLFYGATSVSGATVAGSNVDMTVVRLLGNSSGGSVTIREIGLKVRLWYNPTTRYHYMIARDSVNQDVDNGETAVILYTLRTTV